MRLEILSLKLFNMKYKYYLSPVLNFIYRVPNDIYSNLELFDCEKWKRSFYVSISDVQNWKRLSRNEARKLEPKAFSYV